MQKSPLVPLNKRRIRQSFERAAKSYDDVAVLQREITDRLVTRLALIKQPPRRILDVGCGTGYGTRALSKRYPRARVTGVDLAHKMVRTAQDARHSAFFQDLLGRRERYLCGDAECLPIATRSVDMVFSNLSLPWCDPERVFAEFARVLRPGGLLMFTSFGPDTLQELRKAWRAVDNAPHVHDFIDMHDLGDALLRASFADPVMDVEHVTLTYRDNLGVLRDLKALGAHNAVHGQASGLLGKQRFARFQAAHAAHARRDGLFPASFEVVYGHAWAPARHTGSRIREDGSVRVPIASIQRRQAGGGHG